MGKTWTHVEAAEVVRGDIVDYDRKVAEVRSVTRDSKGQIVIENIAARSFTVNPSTPVEVYR